MEIPSDDDPLKGWKEVITPEDGDYLGINIFEVGRPLITKFDLCLKFKGKSISGYGKDRDGERKAFEVKGNLDAWEVRFLKIYKDQTRILYIGHEIQEFKIHGDVMFINKWEKGRGEPKFSLYHVSNFLILPTLPVTVLDTKHQTLTFDLKSQRK